MIPIDTYLRAEHTAIMPVDFQMAANQRHSSNPNMCNLLPHLKLLATLLAAVLLVGCTNSKLIIGPLYNRMDDQMRSEFNKLGKFNEEQKLAFEQAVGTFHVWHRQSEMPLYADLIQEFAASIATEGATTQEDIKRWAQRIEQYSQNARQCHPANYLFSLIQSLSDQQINFIERRFRNERKRNREKYAKRTKDERIERRLKNIVKWSGRLGLELRADQKAILRESFRRQISLRDEYYALSDAWNRKLFVLARDQQNPDYQEVMADHVSTLWNLMERNHPEQWKEIRELWRNTSYVLIESLSDSQRSLSSRWLNKMGRTVRAISKDKPSFKVGTDPSVGCLVVAN